MSSEAWEISNRWHGSESGGGEGHWPCEDSTFCHARRPLHVCLGQFSMQSLHTRVSPSSHFPPHGVVFTLHSASNTGRVTRAAQREFVVTDQSLLCALWKTVCWSTMFLNIVSELTVKLPSEPSLWLHSYLWRYRNANANRWNNNRWRKYDSTGPNFIGKLDELRWAPERTFEKHMLQVCHEIFLFYSICQQLKAERNQSLNVSDVCLGNCHIISFLALRGTTFRYLNVTLIEC